MKRHALILIFSAFSASFTGCFAEEGMLIPSIIAAFESDMKAKGMKLSAQDIYNVNHSSLKDAIIHFNGGCTSELVSSHGLLLTNHHCGYSQIQSHSSVEKDYLKNGFWAKNYSEELPNAGLTATRMVRIDDITKDMIFGISETDSPETKEQKLRKNAEQLIKSAVAGTHYEAEIKPFNYGNDYYIIVKETFKDIRLVGTPPNSIGKFGGDTDNWVWPRHTGDFSVFRIYAGVDNKPAAYSSNNIPYTPIHFLPISFKNRKVGDFTMVYGFPGETEQHVASGYLKFIIDVERPARISMREKSLSIIDAAMRSSDELRIKYAAKQASIANAYKKWIGQISGLKELNSLATKIERENNYNKMAATNPAWNKRYGGLVAQMNALCTEGTKWEFANSIGTEYLGVGPEVYRLARGVLDLSKKYATYKEKGELQGVLDKMAKGAEDFFKNYDAKVDQQIFDLLTEEYLKQSNNPDLNRLIGKIPKTSHAIYTKSFLTNKERYISFIKHFNDKSLKKLEKDPAFKVYKAVVTNYRENVVPKFQEFDNQLNELLKIYVAGKYEMFPTEKHWADANSTLRITYGQLEGSSPVDGMAYTEHTTLDGMIAKYTTGNPDFELLPRMLELHKNKDYGNYGQDGELWVCFTGSNHTTGGNSGSPVIDANGNLMGLNFDRTWESTMSDFMFDTSRCRNIVVDIRYVMWVMDKYAGAKHLVDEMTLISE